MLCQIYHAHTCVVNCKVYGGDLGSHSISSTSGSAGN